MYLNELLCLQTSMEEFFGKKRGGWLKKIRGGVGDKSQDFRNLKRKFLQIIFLAKNIKKREERGQFATAMTA